MSDLTLAPPLVPEMSEYSLTEWSANFFELTFSSLSPLRRDPLHGHLGAKYTEVRELGSSAILRLPGPITSVLALYASYTGDPCGDDR